MTETEKLIRDIETLRESIQLSSLEMFRDFTPEGRQAARCHISLLQNELAELLEKLWSLDEGVGQST